MGFNLALSRPGDQPAKGQIGVVNVSVKAKFPCEGGVHQTSAHREAFWTFPFEAFFEQATASQRNSLQARNATLGEQGLYGAFQGRHPILI